MSQNIQLIISLIRKKSKGKTLLRFMEKIERDFFDFADSGFYLGEYNKNMYLLWDREVEFIHDIFKAKGYRQVSGAEVVPAYLNFDSLNITPDHPARNDHDTFIVNQNQILRTHTTSISNNLYKKEDKYYILGKTYRNEKSSKHSRNFHQLDFINSYIGNTIEKLHSEICSFLYSFIGSKSCHIRRSYFPFTVFSFEFDVLYKNKYIEVLGCGMLNTSKAVTPTLAAGMGVERLIIVKYLKRYNKELTISDLSNIFL